MSPILGIIASGTNVASGSFESIATATGTGSANTVTFDNIPGTYQHLQIRFIGKSSTSASANCHLYRITFNGSTSTYAYHTLRGDGSTAEASGSATQANISSVWQVIPNSGSGLDNMMGAGIIDIHDYASTSKAKTLRAISGTDINSGGDPLGMIDLHSGLWYATPAAITSITLTISSGNWTTSSQFALYGIKGA